MKTRPTGILPQFSEGTLGPESEGGLSLEMNWGSRFYPTDWGRVCLFLFYAKFVVALGSTTTHHEFEEADC